MTRVGIRRPSEVNPAAPGDVYFIQAEDGGPIKIGVAADVDFRLRTLQIGCPLRLRVLAVEGGAGAERERELHERFQADRLHGEWFSPTPELLAHVQELCTRELIAHA